MDSKVRVTATAGKVINVSEGNPEYGFIRVAQERAIVDEGGFIRVKTLSALVPGTIADLKKLSWTEGQFIPGKVVIKEQLTPFNKKNPDNNLKIAGETGIVCRSGEDAIYRNTFWRTSASAEDVIIPHTNAEEIKAAYAAGLDTAGGEAETREEFSL